MANYRHYLTIHTGDYGGAGTDEFVYLFFSVDGIAIAGSVKLGGSLEKNAEDHWYVDSPTDFHAADHVHLRITNHGTDNPNWYCSSVIVSRSGWSKTFKVNDWIYPGENYKSYPQYIGDGVPERVAEFERFSPGTTVDGLLKLQETMKKSSPKSK